MSTNKDTSSEFLFELHECKMGKVCKIFFKHQNSCKMTIAKAGVSLKPKTASPKASPKGKVSKQKQGANAKLTVEELQAKKKALQEQIEIIKSMLPQKETEAYVLKKRGFTANAYDDLLSLSKTSKTVLRLLKGLSVEDFKTMLSPTQAPGFNVNQYNQLLKSATLVVKMMSKAEKYDFIEAKKRVSPSRYLNVIVKGSCLRTKTFAERKSGK